MSKYVVKRKDVCAGELCNNIAMSYKMLTELNMELSKGELASLGITDLSVFGGIFYRGMLFNVNEDGLANDLIYTTPTNYPITRIQPRFDVESNLVINHYVELEELLKYLNYGVDLTQSDLNEIYDKLISHKWWLEHHVELFGYKKSNDGSFSSGGIEILPKTIYDNLSSISCFENGRPSKKEPGYSLIKKRSK